MYGHMGSAALEIVGDSDNAVGWAHGLTETKSIAYRKLVAETQRTLFCLTSKKFIRPRHPAAHYFRHVIAN